MVCYTLDMSTAREKNKPKEKSKDASEPTPVQPEDTPEVFPGEGEVLLMPPGDVIAYMEAHPGSKRRREVVSVYAQKIGDRIRLRRRELGWKQERLAAELGLRADSVSRYEAGITDVGASDLPRLAGILKVPVAYFFEPFSYSSAQVVADMMFGLGKGGDLLSELELAELRQSMTTETETLRYLQTLAEPYRRVLLSNAKALYELQVNLRQETTDPVVENGD